MPFKVDEIADLLGKFANARLQEDEDSPVFVDDFVEQIIGDMDIDDLNKEEIAEYFNIVSMFSSISSRLRLQLDEELAIRILEELQEEMEEK